jgi:hypothetical protein
MGCCESPPRPQDPAAAAAGGIQADLELQPYNYLVNAAAQLGRRTTINGRTFDFTGLGQADTAGVISDQMAQTLLDLQRETSPTIIQQRLDELKAADPEGYAARQQLFDRIMADAQNHPGRPVNTELQQSLQDELSKGAGFDDAKQEQQVRDSVRGSQVSHGITLGSAPTSQEAKTVLGAGESLRNTREQNALSLLQSGASPEDIAYREMQQAIGNLANFQSGTPPEAQFQQVGSAGMGFPQGTPGAPNTNSFNPNAAQNGLNFASGVNQGQMGFYNSQSNPWLTAFSSTAAGVGATRNIEGNNGGGLGLWR